MSRYNNACALCKYKIEWEDTQLTNLERHRQDCSGMDRSSYKIIYENGFTELSQIKCHTCSLYTVQKYLYFPGSNLSQMMSGVFGIL